LTPFYSAYEYGYGKKKIHYLGLKFDKIRLVLQSLDHYEFKCDYLICREEG